MKGNDLHISARDPNTPLGKLSFKSLNPATVGRKGIDLEMDFVPFQSFVAVGSARWLALSAIITDQKVDQSTFGRVVIDLYNAPPPVSPITGGNIKWFWRLRAEDLAGC